MNATNTYGDINVSSLLFRDRNVHINIPVFREEPMMKNTRHSAEIRRLKAFASRIVGHVINCFLWLPGYIHVSSLLLFMNLSLTSSTIERIAILSSLIMHVKGGKHRIIININ